MLCSDSVVRGVRCRDPHLGNLGIQLWKGLSSRGIGLTIRGDDAKAFCIVLRVPRSRSGTISKDKQILRFL